VDTEKPKVSIVSTSAVLLRSFNYGETSRVLRLYTRDFGLVSVMAKGIRRRGARGRAAFGTFSRGEITFYRKSTRELQTFKEFAVEDGGRSFGRDVTRFAGASVLAEIVLAHAGPDRNTELFTRLTAGLHRIESKESADVVNVVLSEGWMLVGVLGYEPQLDDCVRCSLSLEGCGIGRFDYTAGGICCSDCGVDVTGPRIGPLAREQLAALLHGVELENIDRSRAHLRLLHDFSQYHLSGSKPLRSFAFLASLTENDGDGQSEG